MKKQKNKCNICGSPFQPGDIIEVDRITPKALGGKNLLTNFQLLHGHCHDYKKNVVFEEEKDIECVEKKMDKSYIFLLIKRLIGFRQRKKKHLCF